MQQKIKEVFTEDLVKQDKFVAKLYKDVRNAGKKLDRIAKVEEKLASKAQITQKQRDLVGQKEALMTNVESILKVMETYSEALKEELPEEPPKHKKPDQSTQENRTQEKLENEANVVECSIS